MTEMVHNMTIEGEEQTVPDRSGWERPDTLAKLLTGLLATLVVVLTYMATTLSAIKADARNAADTALVTKTESAQMRRDIDRLDNRMDTVEKAYQFQVNNRLARVEAKNGITPPTKQNEE